jgi:polysaccharide export outer membrane protein
MGYAAGPMKTFVVTIGMFLVVGCGPVPYDYSKEPDPRKKEFVIGIPDSLRITVWKNPDLSCEARVRPDGTISMPLIGDLRADGRTPSDLKNEITRRLAAFVKDEGATVTVVVTEVNSYRFTVGGNVERPGVFTTRHFVTVAEAIALGGGLNRFASPRNVVVIRTDKTGTRRIPIDYSRVGSGEHPEENIAILAGDNVFVP